MSKYSVRRPKAAYDLFEDAESIKVTHFEGLLTLFRHEKLIAKYNRDEWLSIKLIEDSE